jgi:hypothetical protein
MLTKLAYVCCRCKSLRVMYRQRWYGPVGGADPVLQLVGTDRFMIVGISGSFGGDMTIADRLQWL